MRLTRRLFVTSLLATTAAGVAHAKTVHELNLSSSGLALRGVDPVSYFVAGEPQKGNKSISLEHKGGTYRFTSEANKALFEKNPDKYLPAFGGYCAYGTAVNNKVDGDPYIWHIVDGQLYLNITRPVDWVWRRNVPKYIKDANRNWKRIKFDPA
ncbi:MAG: YHS domain-containing (seleno)protein [Litoreibacter sp.]|uniref:YHS domain-containing (seleno)protein n=1 Tax=Litoreibacter sp. TaxID=1969459 RepID=UPI003297EBBE